MSQLAQAIKRPRKAAAAVLDDLDRLGLVEEGAQAGTYHLALAVLRLGSAVMARIDERQAALPVMEGLHQATEETV